MDFGPVSGHAPLNTPQIPTHRHFYWPGSNPLCSRRRATHRRPARLFPRVSLLTPILGGPSPTCDARIHTHTRAQMDPIEVQSSYAPMGEYNCRGRAELWPLATRLLTDFMQLAGRGEVKFFFSLKCGGMLKSACAASPDALAMSAPRTLCLPSFFFISLPSRAEIVLSRVLSICAVDISMWSRFFPSGKGVRALWMGECAEDAAADMVVTAGRW